VLRRAEQSRDQRAAADAEHVRAALARGTARRTELAGIRRNRGWSPIHPPRGRHNLRLRGRSHLPGEDASMLRTERIDVVSRQIAHSVHPEVYAPPRPAIDRNLRQTKSADGE
jgi:hypothetical protein